MSFIGSAIGDIVGGITGANQQAKAAKRAGQLQYQASQQGIDQIKQFLTPYTDAGVGALGGIQDLLGLNGANGYQSAISGIQNGPIYNGLLQQGNNSILANASATGGLRGGNTQAALGQFAPQLLQSLVNQRLQGLGGLYQTGQNSAATAGASIADLLGQGGSALAGSTLAAGNRNANAFGSLLQIGGTLLGSGAFGGSGGGGGASGAAGGSGLLGGNGIGGQFLNPFGG